MSSFVSDNVSESNKQELQITESQENSLETTTDVNAATKNKNPIENNTTTATISNNDKKVNNKLDETNNESTKTINENKSERIENKPIKTNTAEAATATTVTVSNHDYNESNNIVVAAVDNKDKIEDNKDVAVAIDNNQNLNKTDDNKLITAHISTISAAAVLSAATSFVLNMTPGDVEQQQTQQPQQQVSSFANPQIAETYTLNKSKNETLAISLFTSEEDTSLSENNRKISECNAKSSSNMLPATSTIESSHLPPLPPSLTSSIAGSHLLHISSEPTFGVQLRNKHLKNQEHNSNIKKSPTKATGIGNSIRGWRPNTSVPNFGSVIKSGTVSASVSPSMVRKASDSSVSLPRRVSFPKSDNELVTGYLEPANPWEHVYMVKSISEIAELYIMSCQKHNTKPLQPILDHLKAVDLTKQLRRQPLLSLKSIPLAPSDCEALEEVLKRVQYKSIDLSDCKLDETAASALFDMIEYYEATNELDISSNALGMTHRGWTSCIYMISHSQELQVLNAEGNPISKLSADHLGNALSTSSLHTLKLEHCGLKGAPLSGLCFKLWQNKVLKELWLAHNDLDCNDADTIAEMLKCNHYLELIDISNNNIRDEGLRHIIKALIMQSKELERRTTFQRTAAIDDDGDCISPVESSPDLADKNDDALSDWSAKAQEVNEMQALKAISKGSDLTSEIKQSKDSSSLPSIEEKVKEIEMEASSDGIVYEQHKVKPPLISSVGSTIDENDGDEDTDDTVRSSTIRNPLQSTSGGQSMLDKLLSMNSESSSEDGASNLSTDTLAACNSEDASLISDEVFDSAATTTTTTSTNTKAPTNTELEVTSLIEGAETVTSAIVYATAITTAPPQVYIEGKKEAAVLKNPSLECASVERSNKVQVDATEVVLASSPSNLDKSFNIQSSYVINNKNNNNNNPATKKINMPLSAAQISSVPAFSNNTEDQNLSRSSVFEVTADDSDCLLSSGVSRVVISDDVEVRSEEHANVMQHHGASRALDVNKNTKLAEDFDDTHSTDSAFESASEGDISRHLPEEFTRLSTSLESSRFDDIAKELAIETATIASESNECLIAAAAQVTPSSTPTPPTPPFSNLSTPLTETERRSAESQINACLSSSLPSVTTTTSPIVKVGFAALEEPTVSPITTANEIRDKMPKVTIAQDSFTQKYKSNSAICTSPSPIPTPPPPSTSPGGASSGLRRTESSCGFLTQSSRSQSQSNDSLCSDNSLDGSLGSGDLNFSASSHLDDRITKNDTLTRQQRFTEAMPEFGTRTPGGLKALAVWNNNLTKESGYYVSDLLSESVSLELLNIGKNCLSNEFVSTVKESLTKNTTLTTLGLQSAHLSAKGIETLSSILTFGGNSTLQRIDIRDNKLEVESLTKIAEVLKSNTTVTQIDIDDEPKRLSVGSEAHLDYARVLENVRSMCSRNEKTQAQIQQEKSAPTVIGKKRGGYYLGSRKISLTCQSRPLVDASKNVVVTAANSKLDTKRKAGTRLRSPVPSPTTISPSSSPNRTSRFQVFRVPEASPLTSPSAQKPIGGNLVAAKALSVSSAALPITSVSGKGSNDSIYPNITSTSLPTSCSLPSMATISSSTQSVKRLSVSPRSRFLVRKVYEDPNLPLASRFSQPITPPINAPPTPISRNAQDLTARCLDTTLTTQTCKRIEDMRLDSISRSCRIAESVPAQITHPTASVTLPTIITPQQPTKTTTDNTSTPILKLNQEISATTTAEAVTERSVTATIITKQCEQSTNNIIINDNNITNQTQNTTTMQTVSPTPLSTTLVTVPKGSTNIQPSSSIHSTLSTLSSSSESTSPSSSSSSSSSTSPASNADSSDSSSSQASSLHSNEGLSQLQQHDLTVSGQCPIAVFSDNDITLTKNTVNEVFGPVAAGKDSFANIAEASIESVGLSAAQQPENQQQRVRKISWISNPTAVDKLLTLFHNSTTIFQRSSSPETKPVATSTITTADIQLSQSPPTYAEAAAAAVLPTQQPKSQTSLVPMRKQSPPSWTKLSNDIINAATTNNVELANTVATTATAVVTEQSRSFFDAASKQFRDLSKQVFRQNLSFGNESVTTASTSNTIMTTVSAINVQPAASETAGRTGEYCSCGCSGTTTGCSCGNTLTTECNADCLPTDVKQEIKENISPEHTINEETLRTMQKLCGSSVALTSPIASTLTINLGSNEDDNDWINTKESSTTTTSLHSAGAVGPAAVATPIPPASTPATEIQHSAVAETSGIESELQAHKT